MTCALVVAVPLTAAGAAQWPQTDVRPDPSIVFGQLPNGMRYLIRHNASPAGGISLRLRIATGSLEENDSDEGIAHFMEHMAFRGSKHFADGEAFKTLEGLGASRGADSNAFTSSDHTVFMFDVAKSDPAAVDTGMTLLRDMASEATIDPKAVDTEREAVLAEGRQDDVAAFHAYKADLTATLGARVADALLPIGKTDVVQNATAQQIRAFYESHYRPENATLLVVGDVDPKVAEAKIIARFSDWRAAAPAVPAPVHKLAALAGPTFTTFTEPGASSSVDMTWVAPYEDNPDTVAQEYRDLARDVALTILNLRLQKLSHAENPPFLSASAVYKKVNGIADMTDVAASCVPGKNAEALRAIHAATIEIVRDGVRADELSEAVASTRVFFEREAADADTMTSAKLAQDYLEVVDDDGVISSPQDNLALFEKAAKTLSVASVNAELHALFAGRGPSVLAVDGAPVEGGTAALAAAFAAPVVADAAPAERVPAWPYANFGRPGKIVAQSRVADLDLTRVTFANGVRATIKPTKFSVGQVMVAVSFGSGRMGLPKDRKTAAWALGAFGSGGLGKIDVDDIKKVFAAKSWGAAFSLDDDSFALSGATRPEDFASEMQLLTAYLSDPGWRPRAFERAQAGMLSALSQAGGMPAGVYALHASALAHNDDSRWQVPSPDEVRAARVDDAKALLQAALDNGPVEVTVVGDISVADAVKGLQATLGVLPRHFAVPSQASGDEQLPPPRATPLSFTHQGGKDQAIAYIAWPTLGIESDAHQARTLKVLQLIMSRRLFDELRTQDGMTYTPNISSTNSLLTPGYGYLSVATEVPPAKVPDFYAAIDRSIAPLKEKEVSLDELQRARDPHVEDVVHDQQTNAYWLGVLKHSQTDPRWLDLIRTTVPDLKAVTTADVLHAAQTYLTSQKAWKMVVLPEGFVMPAGGAE